MISYIDEILKTINSVIRVLSEQVLLTS